MEWIKVEDRLPSNGQDVLVYDIDEIAQAYFFHGNFDHPYFGQDMSGQYYNVTHWMPLPEPPEQ